MTGTVVNWLLGAALATVASVAGRRLLRGRRTDSAVHLVMALGMAAMLVPADAISAPALRWGFGALALVLSTSRRGYSRGGHRLHHAAMAGIMALMADVPRRAVSAMAPGMVMPSAAHRPSPVLFAAFGYACASALVIAWRLPAPVP